ncbi:uncharacterized protein [Haliotis asinina]|uniref:uncharacterized protein n=1 Tax=Haliotis asinina TaxID=109174 RepID=UPI00353243BE
MMLKVCLALFFVVSLSAQYTLAFGCQNEGQTCNVMNGNTCCNGLTCQYAMGNIRTCQRNIGGGVGGGMGCQNEGQTCNVMNGNTCCNGLTCQYAMGNIRTCQRNIGGGDGGGMGCRRRNEECRINGMPAMSCCASLRCLPGYMNRMTCQ